MRVATGIMRRARLELPRGTYDGVIRVLTRYRNGDVTRAMATRAIRDALHSNPTILRMIQEFVA